MREVPMVARILCSAAVLALSIAAFLGAGPAPAGLNSPGVILLGGAVMVWFAWPAGYSYRRETWQSSRTRPEIMTVGAAPLLEERSTDQAQSERS
jgi:hypothetical protein